MAGFALLIRGLTTSKSMRAPLMAALTLGILAAWIPSPIWRSALAQPRSSADAQPWQTVTKLRGVDSEEYFVLVQPAWVMDKAVFDDAVKNLCAATRCEIGFFAGREDIPRETTSGAFFDAGGWTGRKVVALFSQDASTQYHQLSWDCDAVPQPYIGDCLSPPHPTPAERTLIVARHGPPAFGEARCGMSMAQLRDALAQHANVTKIDTKARNRDVLRTEDKLGDRSFTAFYTLIGDRLTSLLLQRIDRATSNACQQQEATIAEALDRLYGPRDRFSYYDEAKTKSEYLWRFDSGAAVSLDNAGSKGPSCALRIFMLEKTDQD